MRRFRVRAAWRYTLDGFAEAFRWRDFGAARTGFLCAWSCLTQPYGSFPGENR